MMFITVTIIVITTITFTMIIITVTIIGTICNHDTILSYLLRV